MTFTNQQKLDAVERELNFRRRVFRVRVDRGAMTQKFMDEQIGVFEAIRDDYIEKVKAENLL